MDPTTTPAVCPPERLVAALTFPAATTTSLASDEEEEGEGSDVGEGEMEIEVRTREEKMLDSELVERRREDATDSDAVGVMEGVAEGVPRVEVRVMGVERV